MPRVTKSPEVRRAELIDIALRQFLKQGYEKTSIRGIVAATGGKVGMFYHYFKSKEEIFEAALKRYSDLNFERISVLLEDRGQRLPQRLISLFSLVDSMMGDPGSELIRNLNSQTRVFLMGRMLEQLVPGVAHIIEEATESGIIIRHKLPTELLARFLTYGVSAVLYRDDAAPSAEGVEQVKQLLTELFQIQPGVLDPI